MRRTMLMMMLIAAGIAHAAAAPAQRTAPASERALVDEDKRRTYADIGAENGFTKEQWSRFYDQMQGFRYVNGLQVRDFPVPVRPPVRRRK